jgi:hypothetical protein
MKGLSNFKKNMFIWDNGNKENDVEEENKYGEMVLVIKVIG